MNSNSKSGKKDNQIIDNTVILQTLLRIEKRIERLDTHSNLNKEYLTTQEACLFLGCTRGMVWKMVNAGKVTRLKLDNGRTYYASAELKKLIETPIENAA
jgi:excisionase family DNA binding protein